MNRRRALIVAGCVGLGAIGVTAAVVATRDDGSRTAAVRTSRSTAPIPKATVRTTTPLGDAYGDPVVGDGAIWVAGPEGARRIDPSSGAIVASLPVGHAPTAFGDAAFWTVTRNTDRRCDGPSSAWEEYAPLRVEKIDAATNTVAFGTDLPGTCRYGRDNRSPSPELVVGSGSAWVREPATCRLFEIDASRGTVAERSEVVGGLVTADAGGPWIVTGPGPYGSSASCVAAGPLPGSELARLDHSGTVADTFHLPEHQAITDVAVGDGLAWVTSVRGREPTPTLSRIDITTGAVRTTRIVPGSVATGEGRVWFLGSFPESGRTNPGLLGEIDPDTGGVKRAFQLDLGSGRFPGASIVAVSEDAVWIVTGRTREVIQVAT